MTTDKEEVKFCEYCERIGIKKIIVNGKEILVCNRHWKIYVKSNT